MPGEKEDGEHGSSREDDAKKACLDSSSDEESSMDEDESEHRKAEILDDLSHLEKQFAELKDQLYRLRIKHADEQLLQVQEGTSPEYLQQVEELEVQLQRRHHVADKLKQFRLQSITNKCECELQAARQHLENERQALLDFMMADLEERLQRAEEDRQNLEFSQGLIPSTKSRKRSRRSDLGGPEKRRKPVTVSGPVIIYMLPEMEIIEDWATIKRARLRAQPQSDVDSINVKSIGQNGTTSSAVSIKYEDGQLCYKGLWFLRGSKVIFENKSDGPQLATITALSPTEVCLRQQDGTKTKLFTSQLQRGKFTLRFQD